MEYSKISQKAPTMLGDRNSQSLGKCQHRGTTFTPKGHRLQFQRFVVQSARNQSSISAQHNTTLLHLSGQH